MPDWGGGAKGALGGAAAGAALGPLGMAIGGGLGGLMGLFGGGSPDEAQQRAQAQLSESGYGGTINQSGQQGQGNLAQQQAFIDQLRGQMNGTGGPSVAQQMLNQQTQANAAASASAIGSQRGLNPALAARMILDQQAAGNQQAAGQGALLRANEQTALRGQMGAALGQYGAQNAQMYGMAGGLQNQQNANRINNAQGGAAAYANQQGQNNAALGGLLGGAGAAAAQFAPGAGKAWSFGGDTAGNAHPSSGGHIGVDVGGGGNSAMGGGGDFAHGGPVSGSAPVRGDSPANDTVHARLSPGEIVIPRSIALSPEAPDAAAAFIRAIQHQHKQGAGYADGGLVVPTANVSTDPFARLGAPQGFAGTPPPDAPFMGAPPTGQPEIPETPAPFERPASADAGLSRVLAGGSAFGDVKIKPPEPETPAPTEKPKPGAQAPTGSGQALDLGRAQKAEQAAIAQQGDIAKQRADAESGIAEAQAKAQEEIQQKHAAILDQRIKNSQQLFSDYASSKIDPQRYWATMDTGGKISSAIGLLLGGLGAGLSHGPNLALGVIDKAIDRDLEVQKLEMGKKQNALSHYLQETGDIRQAMILAKADARDVAAAQMTAAGMKFGGQQVAAQTAAAVAGLQKQGIAERTRAAEMGTDLDTKRFALAQAKEQAGLQDAQRLALRGGLTPQNLALMPQGVKDVAVIVPGANGSPSKVVTAPTKEAAKKANEQIQALTEGQALLSRMRKVAADHNGDILPGAMGKDSATAASQVGQLTLMIKTMGELGVLSKDDMKLVEPMMPDPASMTTRSATNEARFAELDAYLRGKMQSTLQQIGAGR